MDTFLKCCIGLQSFKGWLVTKTLQETITQKVMQQAVPKRRGDAKLVPSQQDGGVVDSQHGAKEGHRALQRLLAVFAEPPEPIQQRVAVTVTVTSVDAQPRSLLRAQAAALGRRSGVDGLCASFLVHGVVEQRVRKRRQQAHAERERGQHREEGAPRKNTKRRVARLPPLHNASRQGQ